MIKAHKLETKSTPANVGTQQMSIMIHWPVCRKMLGSHPAADPLHRHTRIVYLAYTAAGAIKHDHFAADAHVGLRVEGVVESEELTVDVTPDWATRCRHYSVIYVIMLYTHAT